MNYNEKITEIENLIQQSDKLWKQVRENEEEFLLNKIRGLYEQMIEMNKLYFALRTAGIDFYEQNVKNVNNVYIFETLDEKPTIEFCLLNPSFNECVLSVNPFNDEIFGSYRNDDSRNEPSYINMKEFLKGFNDFKESFYNTINKTLDDKKKRLIESIQKSENQLKEMNI